MYDAATTKQCLHCGRARVNRPKGLCWSCYYKPGVRELHPSASKYARRGLRDFNGAFRLPTTPTTAIPGTEAKLQVLSQRAERGECLFHDDDATLRESMWATLREDAR